MWVVVGLVVVVAAFFTVFFGAPYVPAKGTDVRAAFDRLRPLTKNDIVLDLGSGDGKILREVSRRGAHAVGYELHPFLVDISRLMSYNNSNVEVHWGNFWRMEFPAGTTVVYIFGDNRDIKKFAKKIENESSRLGNAIDVVSYGFSLPGHTAIASAAAHKLYRIQPLLSKKA